MSTTHDALGLARPRGWTSSHDWPGACRVDICRERRGAAAAHERAEVSIAEAAATLEAWRAQSREAETVLGGELRSERAVAIILISLDAHAGAELRRSLLITPNEHPELVVRHAAPTGDAVTATRRAAEDRTSAAYRLVAEATEEEEESYR